MNRIILALVGICALLALTACGPSYPYEAKQIKVEEQKIDYTVHFPKGSTHLGLSERRKMDEFVGSLRPESVQRVEIETHGDHGLSHARAHLIKSKLIEAGLPTPIFRHDYINKTVPDVNVHVTYATARVAQRCPDWGSRATPNFSNQIWSNYSCATKTNIAAQTANAMDLNHGRNIDAPDADRTQALMAPYKVNTRIANETDSATSAGQ